jgi:hypothetical protein
MKIRFAYSFGLQIGYHINQRLTLNAGASFSRKGGQTEDITYNPGIPTGETVVNTSQRFSYDHFFVCVPVEALYTIGSGKQTFYAGAGINTEFYLKTKTVQKIDSRSDGTSGTVEYSEKMEPYRSTLLSGMLTIGYQQTLSDRLHIQAGPRFQFPLMGMLKSDYVFVNHRLYALQFNFSINYSF